MLHSCVQNTGSPESRKWTGGRALLELRGGTPETYSHMCSARPPGFKLWESAVGNRPEGEAQSIQVVPRIKSHLSPRTGAFLGLSQPRSAGMTLRERGATWFLGEGGPGFSVLEDESLPDSHRLGEAVSIVSASRWVCREPVPVPQRPFAWLRSVDWRDLVATD